MIFDSFAWIELMKGTQKGEKAKQYLDKRTCYTSIVTLSEIVEWCLKLGKNPNFPISTIVSSSTILFLDKKISLLAGRINFERKKKIKNWGMLDSFILAVAMLYNLQILTGDEHFKDLPNVEML